MSKFNMVLKLTEIKKPEMAHVSIELKEMREEKGGGGKVKGTKGTGPERVLWGLFLFIKR